MSVINTAHGGDTYSCDLRCDFSANLNPLGMPQSVKQALVNSVRLWESYPDPFCRELISRLSDEENIGQDKIVCGNGAADLIYRITQAFKPKRSVITAPAFGEYEKALRQTDSEVIKYRLSEQNDFELDEGILNVLDKSVDMLFLCSPNNPTGRTIRAELLQRTAKKCLEENIIFVCDECFMPFVRDSKSLTARRCMNKNTIILKAFTKIYAIAGLRLGYAVFGCGELAGKVRETGQYWSVSAPAQTAGTAALSERSYIDKTRLLIDKERGFLSAALTRYGFKVFPSDANFILFRCKYPLDKLLLREKILIRNCADYDGLSEGFFRIAVRGREENSILINAVGRVIDG